MASTFRIFKAPHAEPDRTSYATREEATAGIRELFSSGLAERGDFYIVESDQSGKVIDVFDVDDEIAPPRAVSGST